LPLDKKEQMFYIKSIIAMQFQDEQVPEREFLI
jgi:hypothetical protein